MKWSDLEAPWRAAFEQAWAAYCGGSIPIGAALADADGAVLAVGRSMQFEREVPAGRVGWSKLSHAELNALLQVSAHDYADIRSCTLYTTVEPCPLCFGALVMSNVRSLRFAARDRWAGSAELNHASEFIRSKKITVSGPFDGLDAISSALHTEYVLRTMGAHGEDIAAGWNKDCPRGVALARAWLADNTLQAARESGKPFAELFDRLTQG